MSTANEAGPYVLVGHSYGGLIVRLYASMYPKDVPGLVLVDASPRGFGMQRHLSSGRYSESCWRAKYAKA